MTKEEFKKQLEYPLNHEEDVDFWKSIHLGATIERTLRLALQYPSLAQEYLDSLPKATMDLSMEEKKIIGEVFEFEGAVLQAIEVGTKDMNCGECYFNLNNNCNDDVHCLPCERTDGKNVIFKEINKTMPTREEVGKMLPIIKAYAEGKTIQFRAYIDDEWRDVKELSLNGSPITGEYRIKPEPTYRPFKNQEECWEEILKHECYGWVKSKDNNDRRHISSIQKDDEDNAWFIIVSFGGIEGFSSEQMFENFKFLDGTPFGIKEE